MLRSKQKTVSKDFKKKTGFSESRIQAAEQTKLSQLKAKLQKQRQLMKTTGKRFREQVDAPKKILSKQKGLRQKPQENINKDNNSKQKIKQSTLRSSNVSLTELSSQISHLSISKTFEKQKAIQQINNKEVYEFLASISLQKFYHFFIEHGFDQIDIIMQITTQTLNNMKMKANQQKRLFQAIKKKKDSQGLQQIGLGTEEDLSRSYMGSISSRNRIKTISDDINLQDSRSRKAPQKPQKKVQNFFFSSNTDMQTNFFANLGHNQWKLMDSNQQGYYHQANEPKKACNECYKVIKDGIKSKQNKYYCCKQCLNRSMKTSGFLKRQEQQCEGWGVELSRSLVREYKFLNNM